MVSQLTGRQGGAVYTEQSMERLRGLHEYLGRCIRGQLHVVDRVASVLTRGELGLANTSRPRGSFLFVGPTGVGKTEITNAFTSYLFGRAKPIRFDMSEYQLQSSVEKLIGEGRDDTGLLGLALVGKLSGTILFDEIEKAHPLVLDLLLQIMENGHITLATGKVCDLRGYYVICTSNIGSSESMRMESAPFASVERTVMMRVREQLRPELLGRINEIVVFARLDYSTQRAICEKMIDGEMARLRALGHDLVIESSVIEFLVREGYHRMLGARPMRATVERQVQKAVAVDLLHGGSGCGRLIVKGSREIILARHS